MPYKDPAARRAQQKAFRQAHPELCHARDAASRQKNAAQIKETRKRFKQRHKAAILAYNRAYRQAHPEITHARNQRYYTAHLEEDKVRQQRNRLNRREQNNAYNKAYYQAHPDLHVVYANRRRARMHGADATLTHEQWLLIQAHQDHRCAYCGKRCKGKLTQDHILALSKGGAHTLHNVIGACKSCNNRKYTGPPPIPVQPLLL
jgi:5-methylcytosine-specific restriction endonuclease McrA